MSLKEPLLGSCARPLTLNCSAICDLFPMNTPPHPPPPPQLCIKSKTEQPILCKSGVCDIWLLVCLFVSDILCTNLVKRSCIVQQSASCLHQASFMRDCIWRNTHTSELCVNCPPSQDPTCSFYKLFPSHIATSNYSPGALYGLYVCATTKSNNLIHGAVGAAGSWKLQKEMFFCKVELLWV